MYLMNSLFIGNALTVCGFLVLTSELGVKSHQMVSHGVEVPHFHYTSLVWASAPLRAYLAIKVDYTLEKS